MAAKQLMPNQCTPLHFLYGPADCCLCGARSELARFKAVARDDVAHLLALLPPQYVETKKLMTERYQIEDSQCQK